jgi:molybdenum ABC transporter ATP-binding protein
MTGLDCRVQYPLAHYELAVELSVKPGVTVLLGPNGAGKSSLLRLLAGLNKPRAGRIQLNERLLFDANKKIDLPPEQRRIGMVFQDLALFPHLNVRQNTAFGLSIRHRPKAEVKTQVDALLDRLGIAQLAERKVTTLSGGERQKIALARTLITDPQLLLLDEPTAALDPSARGAIRRWLHQILGELQIPTLLVTHDAEEVAWFRKRVAVIEKGQIVQRGSYHQLLREPQSDFVARFAGINLISGEVSEQGNEITFHSTGGSSLLGIFDGVLPGPATMAVAPWEIGLFAEPPGGSPQNVIPGRVIELIVLGDRVRSTLLGAEKLVVEISHKAWKQMGEFGEGTELYAVFKSREARVMNT